MQTNSTRPDNFRQRKAAQRLGRLAGITAIAVTAMIVGAGCGDSSEKVGTPDIGAEDSPFPLNAGTTSVTGPYPGGSGSCGSTGDEIRAKYPGFQMAAVPSKFFSTYNPGSAVGLSCDPQLKVVVDESGKPLCYEIESAGESRSVVVADVCAGNCVSNVATCGSSGAAPSNDCGQNSASCLDCSDHPTQFEAKWRCPPMAECYSKANSGESWTTHMGPFYASDFGINTGGRQCTIPGFSPSADFPSGHVDYCSGENPHFDIQHEPFADANSVATYKRVDCPSPS